MLSIPGVSWLLIIPCDWGDDHPLQYNNKGWSTNDVFVKMASVDLLKRQGTFQDVNKNYTTVCWLVLRMTKLKHLSPGKNPEFWHVHPMERYHFRNKIWKSTSTPLKTMSKVKWATTKCQKVVIGRGVAWMTYYFARIDAHVNRVPNRSFKTIKISILVSGYLCKLIELL